jgi:hypothetical protein
MADKTIIYVIGAGRSGTTLLDVMLGNASDIFSAGELNRYCRTKGIQAGLDQSSERTRFWRDFSEQFSPKYDLDRQERIHREIEYHSGLVKRLANRMNRDHYREFQDFERDFFDVLFRRIDESMVVDSSKYPGRALALSDTLPYRLCLIYITRDPVRVVHSYTKTDRHLPTKSWGEANCHYFLINHLCKRVLKQLRKKHSVVEIRYEDLVSQPEATLRRLANAFDVDLSSVIDKVRRDEFLRVGNLFAGNTLRMQEKIKLQRELSTYPNSFRNRVTRMINMTVYK